MNLTSLQDRTRKLSGVQMTELLSDTELNQFINEAYQEIAHLHDWPWRNVDATISVVAGDTTYTISAPVRNVRALYNATTPNKGQLRPRRLTELDNDPDDTLTGAPAEYALASPTELIIWPKPDGAYTLTLHGVRDITPLTAVPPAAAGSDVPLFDDDYHAGIAYLAAAAILIREGDDSGRSKRYQEEATSYVDRMRRDYLGDHDTNLIILGGRHSPLPHRRYRGR